MRSINTSIFDFPTLRSVEGNYVYVDKTAQLYELAKPSADRIYYLPRRMRTIRVPSGTSPSTTTRKSARSTIRSTSW